MPSYVVCVSIWRSPKQKVTGITLLNAAPILIPLVPPLLNYFPSQRPSLLDPETSSVPREYRHLVTLAALLPQRVIETLVVQRRLGKPSKPRFATEGVDAALLFIDISGFTASMEMFAQQGSQGIEKFWKMFNAYFCDLLDVIEVHVPP